MRLTFGEQRINVWHRLAGTVRVTDVLAAPALNPRLVFLLEWDLHDLVPDHGDAIAGYELVDLAGEIQFDDPFRIVGVLQWLSGRRRIMSYQHGSDHQISLVCDLDPLRLEKLENLRQARPLQLTMHLFPRFEHGGKEIQVQLGSFRISIPRDNWAFVLANLGHPSYDLLEVRFPLAHADRFRSALDLTRQAEKLVDRAEYPAAILACRKALDALDALLPDGPKRTRLLDALTSHVGLERAGFLSNAVGRMRDLGNVEAHENPERPWRRAEAVYAIRLCQCTFEMVGAILES